MGTDMRVCVEARDELGKWQNVELDWEPFSWRDYGMYGVLAGVRNHSAVPPITEPRGWPEDVSDLVRDSGDFAYSHCYYTLAELLSFDWDAEIEDRRCTVQTGPRSWDGGATCDPGKGIKTTYRRFLGERFFRDIERLRKCGNPDDVRLLLSFL